MPNSAEAQLHQCLGRNLTCLARISIALQLKGLFQLFHDRPDIRPLIATPRHCSYVVLPKPGPCPKLQEMDQAIARSISRTPKRKNNRLAGVFCGCSCDTSLA